MDEFTVFNDRLSGTYAGVRWTAQREWRNRRSPLVFARGGNWAAAMQLGALTEEQWGAARRALPHALIERKGGWLGFACARSESVGSAVKTVMRVVDATQKVCNVT